MNKPTFLIVGAAKSGTTSVYHYLKQHPQIFLPTPKEPKYVSSRFIQYPFRGPGDDFIETTIAKTSEQYYRLFEGVKPEIAEIGDASADNLYYHEKAIPLIREEFGDPKILIFLRNPVQRAFSAYSHLIRESREKFTFMEALEMEEERIKQNYEFLWHYKKVGLYAPQVEAYLQNFTSVKIFLFEDIINNKNKVIKEIFHFLGVRADIEIEDEQVYNVSGRPKSRLLFQLLKYPNPIKNSLKLIMPAKMRQQFRRKVDNANLSKMKIDETSQKYLKEYYREDIRHLEKIINRELSAWTK